MSLLLGLSLISPPWLALNTSKGKASGLESWLLNPPIVYLSIFKGSVPRNRTHDRTLKIPLHSIPVH